jgi:hypothetical protein
MKRAYRQMALHRAMIQAQADEQREQEQRDRAPVFHHENARGESLYDHPWKAEAAHLSWVEREQDKEDTRAYLASLTPYERETHGLLIGPVYRPRLDPMNPEHPEHPQHVPF